MIHRCYITKNKYLIKHTLKFLDQNKKTLHLIILSHYYILGPTFIILDDMLFTNWDEGSSTDQTVSWQTRYTHCQTFTFRCFYPKRLTGNVQSKQEVRRHLMQSATRRHVSVLWDKEPAGGERRTFSNLFIFIYAHSKLWKSSVFNIYFLMLGVRLVSWHHWALQFCCEVQGTPSVV